MKKAANRMRLKIRNLIDELHHKAALFLAPLSEQEELSLDFTAIVSPKY